MPTRPDLIRCWLCGVAGAYAWRAGLLAPIAVAATDPAWDAQQPTLAQGVRGLIGQPSRVEFLSTVRIGQLTGSTDEGWPNLQDVQNRPLLNDTGWGNCFDHA
jgi:hypothetical protein